MNTQFWILILILFSSVFLPYTFSFNQTEVDYYVELIQNRTQEALTYKFPTDARMYEADDMNVEGNIKKTYMRKNF